MNITLPMSTEAAYAFLEERNPALLAEMKRVGYPHMEELLRNVRWDDARRISSGELTEEEIQDPNAFYLIRHAASVVAADTAPYA